MPDLEIRKWVTFSEEIPHEGGPGAGPPLVKAAVAGVIANPYASRWSEDLDDLIGPGTELARELVHRCACALNGLEPEGCGKGAIVGVAGEHEHGVACLTTPFGDAMRERIGGGTWVTSTTKASAAGASIDVPLAYKAALFVRAFYDTITVTVPDAPRPDEIVVIAAMSTRGRVHGRVGGLTVEETTKGDALR